MYGTAQQRNIIIYSIIIIFILKHVPLRCLMKSKQYIVELSVSVHRWRFLCVPSFVQQGATSWESKASNVHGKKKKKNGSQ